MTIERTNSENSDFQLLVKQLDKELAIRDGSDHAFYHQFNKIDAINHVVVAYQHHQAIGCGALKKYSTQIMEVKRMFVPLTFRGKGVAGMMLNELEKWAKELGFTICILETGINQPEAIRLYEKSGYNRIENYGQYMGLLTSVCFQKEL